MSRAGIIGLSVAVVCIAFILIVLNMPVRLFAGHLLDEANYTDLHGASLTSGDVWLNVEGIQGPVHVLYHWCPGSAPLRWCVSLEHASVNVDTRLILRGLDTMSLQNMQVTSLDLQALGVAGGLIRGRLSGVMDRVDWRMSECPLLGVEELQGSLSAAEINIFGTSTGAHRLDMTTVDEGINMNLTGDTFSGTIEIRGNQYLAEGELIAPESMMSMAQSLMRPLGGNRFGWEISGSLPC